MKSNTLCALILALSSAVSSAVAFGDDTTQPSTAPASSIQRDAMGRVVSGGVSAASPTTAPATSPSAKFPTPAEVWAKMQQQQAKQDALYKVAHIDLSDGVSEKPPEFSLFAGGKADTLHETIAHLRQAKNDKNVKAVLITMGGGHIALAQAQEIRDELAAIGEAHKPVFVYADGYDTDTYTVASGATDICMLSGGEVMIPGVGLSTMFYKGAFDKIGVEADYIQVGAYKGAKEPYTQTGPSEELKGELNRLTDNLYAQIVDGISKYRHLSTDAVKAIIDETILTGDTAKERGLIDHVVDEDGMRALIKDNLNHEIDLVHEYGDAPREQLDFSNPFAMLSMLTKKPDVSIAPCVAVIYAEGVITDGEASQSLLGGESGVASEPMRRAFRMAARDDSVKAVVVRIDSPGGSALASEVMWQSLRHLAEKKPVIISVGSMAASGGYYLASAGDTIYADPSGIVGSIGVVGGKFVLKDLYAKLGLNTQTFAKGANAGLFSSDAPFSDQQKAMVQHWMEQTYHQFTQRVLTTRSMKIKDIEQVAQGRIFLAPQAKEIGLVDEIGGTEAAIACAADRAGLAEGKYEVRSLPPAHTLADLLGGGGEEAASPIHPNILTPKITLSPDSILNVMDASTRELITQQLAAVQLLQKRPVMLMSPFVFTTK